MEALLKHSAVLLQPKSQFTCYFQKSAFAQGVEFGEYFSSAGYEHAYTWIGWQKSSPLTAVFELETLK